MPAKRKITVTISQKNYDFLRKRQDSSESKSGRALSRYLGVFFTILQDGEESIHRIFTQAEARRIASILDIAHRADDMPWEELCIFSGVRIMALVGLYAPVESIIMSKLASLGAYEVLALVEYAQTIESPEKFLQQTGKFGSL